MDPDCRSRVAAQARRSAAWPPLPAGQRASTAQARRSRWLGLGLRAGISVAVMLLALRKVDLDAVREPLLRADAIALLGVSAVLGLSYGLGGLRWALILRGMGRAWMPGRLVAIFWAGATVSQFVPSPLSDAARIWIASRRGLDLADAVLSAVLERVAMVLTLLLLVAAVIPLQGRGGPAWQGPALSAGVVGAGALGLALLVMIKTRPSLLPRRLRAAIAPTGTALRTLLSSGAVAPIAVSAVLSHLNVIAAAALLGHALHLPLTPADYLMVMPLIILGTVLPISISGWGVREGVAVGLLVPLGVPAATALAFSVMLGLCLMASSLPGLLLFALGSPGKDVPAPGAALPHGASR